MHPRSLSVGQSRRRFAERLASRQPAAAPVCLDPLTARLVEQLGFEACYVSGGALGFALAVSEALLSVHELADATRAITLRCDLPVIVDGAVGFGDPVHVTRMMWEFEAAGAAAVELEDQVAPKRVSHHRGVEHLVGTEQMVAKVEAAVDARRDPDLLVIARTAAVRHEGIDAACARAVAYVEAGADALLVPMPASDADFARIRDVVDVPLATIGLLDAALDHYPPGVTLVIDSITPHVVAYRAVKELLEGHLSGRPSGLAPAEVMSIYRELGTLAGLEGLYAIERATTEPAS